MKNWWYYGWLVFILILTGCGDITIGECVIAVILILGVLCLDNIDDNIEEITKIFKDDE